MLKQKTMNKLNLPFLDMYFHIGVWFLFYLFSFLVALLIKRNHHIWQLSQLGIWSCANKYALLSSQLYLFWQTPLCCFTLLHFLASSISSPSPWGGISRGASAGFTSTESSRICFLQALDITIRHWHLGTHIAWLFNKVEQFVYIQLGKYYLSVYIIYLTFYLNVS